MTAISRLVQFQSGIATGVDLTTSELQLNQVGLKDTGGDHFLYLASGEDLTAARTLSFILSDADRTLTLTANVALNQNLRTTDSPTFADVTISNTPTNSTHAATKGYVDTLVQGIHWQEPVLDRQVDNTLDPGASPTTGDRYIIEDSGNLHANFGTITGVGDDDIVEYNGSAFVVVWDASVEGEGGAAWVQDEDKIYTFNGTAWVAFGNIITHNNLSGLQGGTTNEYYHLTSAQHTNLTSGNPSFSSLTLTGDITTTGTAIDWDLLDNDASALSFDAAGKAGILEIDTTDGTEGVKMSGYLNIGASTSITSILDEDTMSSDSATALATQQSIKAYVDTAVSGVSSDKVFKTVTIGEAMGVSAETHIYPVRYAKSGETAGRVYLANKDDIANAYAVGFVTITGAQSAGATATMVMLGQQDLGADDTAFNAADVGKPVYLTGSGTYGITAPTTATEAVYRVGIVSNTTVIEVTTQLNGVN